MAAGFVDALVLLGSFMDQRSAHAGTCAAAERMRSTSMWFPSRALEFTNSRILEGVRSSIWRHQLVLLRNKTEPMWCVTVCQRLGLGPSVRHG